MPRETDRVLRENIRKLQAEVNALKARNKELFVFLQKDRERCKQEIRSARKGMDELLVATHLILGEIVRKCGEITIPMPDISREFAYKVMRDEKKRTMTFIIDKDPEETAGNAPAPEKKSGES